MSNIKRTDLRHRMLIEVSNPGAKPLVLRCANVKQGLWKPRRRGAAFLADCTAGESRAVGDLLASALIETPHWQGDMDVDRVLALTEAGRRVLDEWDAAIGVLS